MENITESPTNSEIVHTTPQVIPQEIKPKKSKNKILPFAIVSLLFVCLAFLIYLVLTNKTENILDKINTEESSITEKEDVDNEDTVMPAQTTITGTLSFPGERIPSLRVCAVNTTDQKETCILTEEGQEGVQTEYSILVTPGTYLIYSADSNYKAYYTLCDTYENAQLDPRCNTNFNESNGGWNENGFKCYEDANCRAAFTPLEVIAKENETIDLKTIVQGWYIPCNDILKCSVAEYDVWADYLK